MSVHSVGDCRVDDPYTVLPHFGYRDMYDVEAVGFSCGFADGRGHRIAVKTVVGGDADEDQVSCPELRRLFP